MKYGMTEAKDWTMHAEGGGHPIEPFPYAGDSELFKIKLADSYLNKMHDRVAPPNVRRVRILQVHCREDAESHDFHHH